MLELKRRLFRFSLRTLLCAVLLMASTLGLWRRWEPWCVCANLVGHEYFVYAPAFSTDGKLLATAGDYDATARVWSVESGRTQCVCRGHTANVSSVSFSTTGQTLVTAGHDGTVRLWDAHTGVAQQRLLTAPQAFDDAVFSGDGTKVLTRSFSAGVIRLWSLDTGEVRQLCDAESYCRGASFVDYDKRVVGIFDDGAVRIWRIGEANPELELVGHTDSVFAVSYSSARRLLATGGSDNAVIVWRLADGQPLARWDVGSRVTGLSFTADGRRVIAVALETARILDVETLIEEGRIGGVGSMAQSDRLLAVADSFGDVRLWDLRNLNLLCSLPQQSARPYAEVCGLRFSPDGRQLAATGQFGTVLLWQQRRPEHPWGVAWLPEFWFVIVFTVGVIWSVLRDRSLGPGCAAPLT